MALAYRFKIKPGTFNSGFTAPVHGGLLFSLVATAAGTAATTTTAAPGRTRPGFALAGIKEAGKPLAYFAAALRATHLIPVLDCGKLAEEVPAVIAFEIISRHDLISLP